MLQKKLIQRLPLHIQIAKQLREHIENDLKPGAQLDSEKTLAQKLGVGVSTIREAITTFAHEGLVERCAGRGTFVLDRPTPMPHVAVYARPDLGYGAPNALTSLVSARLLSRLVGKGVRAKMYWLWRQDHTIRQEVGYEELMGDLAAHRIKAIGHVQGMIDDEVLERIQALSVPLVSMDSWKSSEGWTAAEDWQAIIQRAIQYLVNQGRRNIAFLYGAAGARSVYGEAFRRVLAERGLVFRPEWVRGEFHPTLAGAGYSEFRELWTAAAEKPDGLLVMDDVLLPEVAAAIGELKIAVPGQLKVVARATQGAMTCPHFPAVRFETDLATQAEVMADMLGRLVRGEMPAQRRVTVPSRWVEISGGAAVTAGQEKLGANIANAVISNERDLQDEDTQ